VARARHSGSRRWRRLANVAVRRSRHGLDHLAGFSWRTADRLPQPGPRPAAVGGRRRPLRGEAEIGVRVGRVINRHKMAKHFDLTIGEASFSFRRKHDAIAAEAALDGVYVVRANVPAADLDDAATVAAYKSLAQVERAFRCLKTIDLHVRPIHHWNADRVRAHVFLCMLGLYVEHH